MLPALHPLTVHLDVLSTLSGAGGQIFYVCKTPKWAWISTLDWFALIEQLRATEKMGAVCFYPIPCLPDGFSLQTGTDWRNNGEGRTERIEHAYWGELRILITDACPDQQEGHDRLFPPPEADTGVSP